MIIIHVENKTFSSALKLKFIYKIKHFECPNSKNKVKNIELSVNHNIEFKFFECQDVTRT